MGLTFKGGIHPLSAIHHGKPLSENCAVKALAAPDIVKIPLSQHIGAPALPLVKEGDRVKVGQKIGEANGFVSVPCHSSVSGIVLGIEKVMGIMGKPVDAVVIENDHENETAELQPADYKKLSPGEIIDIIKDAGIVGMGGATFPMHVKLSPPPDMKVDTLVVNGAECEPFLTADHRLMLEQARRIVRGVEIVMKALGVDTAYIGIEENKKNAIIEMRNASSSDPKIEICELQTKYPQGGEKQLVYAVTGREIPSGALPAAAGVVVANVASCAAVAERFETGMPLVKRIATVTGSVCDPVNITVPIGTPLSCMLDAAGGPKGEIMKLISGGPMMGLSVPSLDCVATKGTSGLLVLGREYMPRKEKKTACIQCGRCAEGCPMHLLPMRMANASEKENFDACEGLHILDCINCGSCTYVCPAKRDVSQLVKLAKDNIMAKKAAERKKQAEEKKKAEKASEEEK